MTDKQDKEFISETAELIWKWKFATQEAWENRPLEAETKEVQTYFGLQAEELITKVKAHYEPLIAKAFKEGVDKTHKACDETHGEMLKEAIKAERRRIMKGVGQCFKGGN